ncbi:MAG TPA: di-heme-cytochrome C peroxidase [Bradyrhizobium sp.]|uniref:di-heme-cytochrome C peroxidase n=1 Tax=Bradyrhizobium sp. TaxID=376 RepID=UPI002D7E8CFA|nr:di-heme-cytochrome C peroxidase [Bradyrhizobium sp.]HET7887260.1 di-heme-cytochrome C peroxidase [Bradyrhizobium sp.]
MSDTHANAPAGSGQSIPVSPNNPCPFLRGLVAGGYVDGHTVPLPKLTGTIEAATGEKGLRERIAGMQIYFVALFANGLNPLRALKSWWSGADLDELRNGPLDKHGVGSRILTVDGQVDESEIARLATFGKDYADPNDGSTERGLNARQITAFMDANFARGKGHRRRIDRFMMNAEFPVLLKIMGKGEGDDRYLSVAEVRTLFVERKFPARITARLAAGPVPPSRLVKLAKGVAGTAIALVLLLGLAITQFPDSLRAFLAAMPGPIAQLSQLLPPPLPDLPAVKTARWLDQNWSLEDRHWFHHVSQGTKTFPVPYAWFVALEQPRLYLFSRPGLLSDSDYLERFGFIPSPKTVHTDQATLQHYGYAEPARASASTKSATGKWPVENTDGLPVGFARLTGASHPVTGVPQPDLIGLTCAACHSGSIRYKGTSIRFDGGPAMVNLLNLEKATGLSIAYTLIFPSRFNRFATRVLGPNAGEADRAQLKRGLTDAGAFVKAQATTLTNLYDRVHQQDTEEGYGRLDALNRIGNQVFYTDLVASGVSAPEANLHVRDAPVSFPPIWTVPWFWWAQYDASIEQPLIRNAGEALGVSALINLSPDNAPGALFRSSVDIENLASIEAMLRGPDPFKQSPPEFGGLKSPKWPADVFADDPAWKIDATRVAKGRTIYAEICAECHLGPVNDPLFDKQFPDKSFWTSPQLKKDGDGPVLDEVQKGVGGMGTDPGQAHVLMLRTVELPGFLDIDPARDLGKSWGCTGIPTFSTGVPFALALMDVVDKAAQKWMEDKHLSDQQKQELWRSRRNCPNPGNARETHYRARPLNGVWATAPYLHNGSVPSLYWMLKPAAERPKQFCMGLRDFDPQQVGFRVEAGEKPACRHGETLFSATNSDGTPMPGNSNLGHSLEGTPGPGKPGVIGRLLSDDERYELIEYLKTL